MSVPSNIHVGYDELAKLPVDQSDVSPGENQIIDLLFRENPSGVNRFVEELKPVFLVGLLFMLFSLPQISSLIARVLPVTSTSVYIDILIRALLVMIAFWFIKHFYLSRK